MSSAADPRISVIITVLNGERFLADAVASIRRQAYAPREIIIVDDGSTDGTARVAASLGDDIRYVYQTNAGPHSAQNTGLKLARSEIVAFLDPDDYWADDKLELQLPLLVENEKTDIVLGYFQYIRPIADADGSIRYECFLEPTLGVVCFGCSLFRRSVFDRVGLLDPTLTIAGDTDWFIRARELGVKMSVVHHVTLFYRLHANNMTRDKARVFSFMVQSLKKSVDRRRSERGGIASPLPDWTYTDQIATASDQASAKSEPG